MIYLPITTYLDAKIAEINNSISGTANDWVKLSLLGEKPENGKSNTYRLLIEDDFEDENISASAYNVTANVELSFLIPNGDLTKYQSLIDTYIHTLVKHIRNNSAYSYSSAWRLNVMKVGAGDLNNIVDSVLSCTLTMELQIIDNVTIDTNEPDAPTLTSPADGYADGLTDQSFNWTGTADKWEIIIYDSNGDTVLYQTNLENSSFTIPADALLTDGETYTWKARGWNAGGYGEWSSARTFTVNDDPLPAVPVLDEPDAGETETSLTVLFQWAGSARATSYEIVIASDSGFSSILTTVTGLTATYYEYTFSADGTYYWKVRATNGSGSSAYTTAQSFIVDAPLPDYRTGLVAEWVSDTGVTSDENGVSAWVDTISSRSATQSTASNKPYYVMNAQNGKPVIRFSGPSNHQWLTFTSLALTNYTVIIVYKPTAFRAGDSNYMFAGSGRGIFSAINALSIGYGEFDGTRIRAVAYSAGDLNSYKIRSFQNQKLYSNGTEATYSNTQNITGLTLTTIGTRSDNTSLSFKGDIACIRVYDSVLSTTNRAIAEAYLNSVYAIY